MLSSENGGRGRTTKGQRELQTRSICVKLRQIVSLSRLSGFPVGGFEQRPSSRCSEKGSSICYTRSIGYLMSALVQIGVGCHILNHRVNLSGYTQRPQTSNPSSSRSALPKPPWPLGGGACARSRPSWEERGTPRRGEARCAGEAPARARAGAGLEDALCKKPCHAVHLAFRKWVQSEMQEGDGAEVGKQARRQM